MSEDQRLAALEGYRLAAPAREPNLDRITGLAARLFEVPIAAATLVAADRQWLTSRLGIEDGSTPRQDAFCDHAIRLPKGSVMVVEDARSDPRFVDNRLVTGEPHIRFYAGAVLTDRDGHNLGSLCVIDRRPRPRPAEAQLDILRDLAQLVVDQLEGAVADRRYGEQTRLLGMGEAMASLGHWRRDLRTDVIEWSNEMYRIHGVDPAVFQPTVENVFQLYEAADLPELGRFGAALRAEAGIAEAQLRIRRPGGEIRHVLLKAMSEHDVDGQAVALFGVLQDVTEQRRALQQISRSEQRHRLLADNMADVVTRIRLDGSSNYISPAVERLLGYAPMEMAGRPAQAFVYPPDVPLIMQAFATLAGGQDQITVQLRAAHRDGHPVPVETSLRLVRDEQGTPREMVGVIRDISERVRLQAELEVARDAADAANRAKSEFLANMSHELRTPLNGVIGFSRLLADSPNLTPEDRRRVNQVRSAGEALGALINDVLDFSKLEARAVQLESRPFNVGDLISEALAMVEPQAREKRVKLFVTGDDAGVLVGDAFRLRQVLLNFLSNAVKFTEDGSVTVQVEMGEETEAGVHLTLRVIDEGVGIPPDRLPVLFNRFSQADGSVSRTFGGTGLGLAISRELIGLMGGKVGVSSQPGRGSVFWCDLTLPRGDAAERPRRGAKRGKASFPGRRVLVVDDVALNRELTEEMLAQHECACDLASDGEQALAAAAASAYDLILMDVHMPVMDGLAATRALRGMGYAGPIVALTASGSSEQVAACHEAGMDAHLLKPISAQELEQTLARYLSGAEGGSAAPRSPITNGDVRARESLEQMGAPAALRMIGMFQALLDDFAQAQDVEALTSKAHRVAGSAAMIGCQRLGLLARELEDRCRDGQPADAALAAFHQEAAEAARGLAAWSERLRARLAEAGG